MKEPIVKHGKIVPQATFLPESPLDEVLGNLKQHLEEHSASVTASAVEPPHRPLKPQKTGMEKGSVVPQAYHHPRRLYNREAAAEVMGVNPEHGAFSGLWETLEEIARDASEQYKNQPNRVLSPLAREPLGTNGMECDVGIFLNAAGKQEMMISNPAALWEEVSAELYKTGNIPASGIKTIPEEMSNEALTTVKTASIQVIESSRKQQQVPSHVR